MQSNPNQTLETALRDGYAVNVGDSIGRGWQLVSQNLGGFVGFTFVVFLINVVLAIIPLGSIATFVLTAPLNAGYFLVAFKQLRSQIVTFNDFFRGFNTFSPLFIAYILSGLIIFVLSIPALAAGAGFLWPLISGMVTAGETKPTPDEVQAMLSSLNPTLLFIALVLYIPVIYLSIAYTLWIPLVLDRKMQPWQALETSRKLITKNWFGIFFLLLTLGIINFLGALVCGLGLLITIPLTFCALAVLYHDIAGLAMPSSSRDGL